MTCICSLSLWAEDLMIPCWRLNYPDVRSFVLLSIVRIYHNKGVYQILSRLPLARGVLIYVSCLVQVMAGPDMGGGVARSDEDAGRPRWTNLKAATQ